MLPYSAVAQLGRVLSSRLRAIVELSLVGIIGHAAGCSSAHPTSDAEAARFLWCTSSAIYRASFGGNAERLPLRPSTMGAASVELSPSLNRIAVRERGGYGMYDASGERLGRVRSSAPGRRHRLWGDGLLVPIVEGSDRHTQRVLGYELRSPANAKLLRIETPDARFTHPVAEHLIVVEPHSIARFSKRGALIWRVGGTAHEVAAATERDRCLFIDGADVRRVVHLAGGSVQSRVSLRSPIWNLAIDTQGRYSAVTTERRLHTFEEGRLLESIQLDVRYATSLAIADDGRLLVGGQTQDAHGRVLLFDRTGVVTDRWRLGPDRYAFRPEVRFVGTSNRFTVRHGDQLYFGEPGEAALRPAESSGGQP